MFHFCLSFIQQTFTISLYFIFNLTAFVLATFVRVKKYGLFILLFGNFLLALIGAGAASFDGTKPDSFEPEQANNSSASLQKLQHTGFEIHGNQSPAATNCTYRFQHTPGHITFEQYTDNSHFNNFCLSRNYKRNFLCKDYLSHLYPSHNFW